VIVLYFNQSRISRPPYAQLRGAHAGSGGLKLCDLSLPNYASTQARQKGVQSVRAH